MSYKILTKPNRTFDRIAFYGPMGVGKTHCAKILVKNETYIHTPIAAKLKSLCFELYGVSGKDNESRRILQEVSDDLKKYDPHLWIKYCLKNIESRLDSWYFKVVIDDLRFVHEARYLRENGFVLVLVTADEKVRQERIAALYPDTDASRHLHASEQEWKEIEPDLIIDSTHPEVTSKLERLLSNATYRPSWEK